MTDGWMISTFLSQFTEKKLFSRFDDRNPWTFLFLTTHIQYVIVYLALCVFNAVIDGFVFKVSG